MPPDPLPIPTGLHAPISNEALDATEPAEAAMVSDAPTVGATPAGGEISAEGAEVVEGAAPEMAMMGGATAPPMMMGAGPFPEAMVAGGAPAPAPLVPVAPDTSGLSDVGEASFGSPARLEAVIGKDDRVQIMKTADYPWRAHASLLITAADNSQWIGTGWFISPRTLITAGHCVYIKGTNVPGRDGWVRKITVMPGRNVDELPLGSAQATSFRTVVGWAESGDENYDYGAIILGNDLGSQTGWFGFGNWPDGDILGSTANVSGYPGDKPSGTQWYHYRKVSSVNPSKVFYAVDTAGGQSGSAVYRVINGARFAMAVHAYGGTSANSGTRISTPVFQNLAAWKAEGS